MESEACIARREDHQRRHAYDAYEVHEYAPRNYGITLVNTTSGARFQAAPVICGRQAHYAATRGGTIPRTFLGVTRMRAGKKVPTSFRDTCDVTDPLHAHVHRMSLPVALS